MDHLHRGLIMIGLCLQCTIAVAQIKVDHERFTKLFNERKYTQLFHEAVALRRQEYGKEWSIDYYIAKSLCAMRKYDIAHSAYTYIEDTYALTKAQEDFIAKEKVYCSPEHELLAMKLQLASLITTRGGDRTEVAISRGKGGYSIFCESEPDAYKFDTLYTVSDFNKRLFALNETQKAENYYRNFLGAGYSVTSSGRFVFITPSQNALSIAEKKNAEQRLEKAYQFYTDYYGIRPPNKLITVYLLGSKQTLPEIARKVHGLRIPKSNLGYSCMADLSVLGNSNSSNLGTIHHELFHIMIRTDIGDIPGWLDEGIACLYEESSWQGLALKGSTRPWRTVVLKTVRKGGRSLPTLATIIRNNWDEFSENKHTDICDIYTNYAMVRHFAIFMQEKGWLQPVVQSFKNRINVFTDSSKQNVPPVKLLEQAVNMSLKNIQSEFDQWMAANYQVEMFRDANDLRIKLSEIKNELSDNKDLCNGSEIQAILEECKKIQAESGYSLNSGSTNFQKIKDLISEADLKLLECSSKEGVSK